jgi:hypothetical protein
VNRETPVTNVFPATDVVRTRADARRPAQAVAVHISGTAVPDCFGELADIDAGTVYVRSERQIPESSSVVISFHHTQLSGIVAGCRPAGPGWIVSIALSASRRRLDERIPHGEEGILGIVEDDRTSLHQCTIIDTSAFGMGLRLGFPVKTGARTCVETEPMMVFGEVRHCYPNLDGEFIAGILIVDVAPDTRNESKFSVMLNNLRWRLASSIRGRDVPAFRSFR